MSNQITVNSFAELAGVFKPEEFVSVSTEQISYSGEPAAGAPELADLLTELQRAGATLATIARRDEEARRLALSELEQYDRLLAEQTQAEAVSKRARYIRRQAHQLADTAFEEEAREAAGRVIELAERSEAQAACIAEEKRRAVEQLASSMDLERLLGERRRLLEVEQKIAAEAGRAERLSTALSGARAALQAGRPEEARALLGRVTNENPDNAEIASLQAIIAQREVSVKTTAAEEAVWAARSEYRGAPERATARLEALELAGVSTDLVKQVCSVWLRACARLCQVRGLHDPVRCSAGFGKLFVAAREQPDAPHTVVGALGMPGLCQVGSIPNARLMGTARPLV